LSNNAINSDGSNYGKTDESTAKGMTAFYLAEKSLLAIANKQSDVVIADAKTNGALLLKSLFPELLSAIVKIKN
jgi:dehydrogenase/reductase SDR family protein 7B